MLMNAVPNKPLDPASPQRRPAQRGSAARRSVHEVMRAVTKRTEAEILAEYPIAGLLPGWYLRLRETSNQAWLAEGSDLWGRQVSCRVDEGDIRPCVAMAEHVQREVESRGA